MTTVLVVTSNPQTFNGGTWNGAAIALNGTRVRWSWTSAAASTTFTGGTFRAMFGQAHGGYWFNDANLEKYTTPGDALVFSKAVTFSSGQTLTFDDDLRAKTITISGATTGNGTFSYAQAGPYFDPTQTMEVGRFGVGTFVLAGTISSIDDGSPDTIWLPQPVQPTRRIRATAALAMAAMVGPVTTSAPVLPDMSWQPSLPAHQLRAAPRAVNAGGAFAPDATIGAPAAPVLSWQSVYPDAAPGPRRPANVGGGFAPEATIPTPPSPPLAWSSIYPDSAPGPRRPVQTGGASQPEATLPTLLPPGLSWEATYPSQHLRARQPSHSYTFEPPLSGGRPLTTGAATIRQNILSQLAFSTPLTTFGTDLTFTASGNTLTTGTHGMVVCAGPFQLATTGTLPAGSDSTTLYYMIISSATTVQLALTPALAKAGTAVTLSDAGTGTHTLVRTRDVAPLYSTLLAVFARGTQSTSPNQATDSAGNTYSYVSGFPRAYDAFNTSAASVSTAFDTKGQKAHTWSASIGNLGGQQDEVVIAGLELFGAEILQSSSVVERADGSGATITSGTVTTTAKALLVAIIFGNGNVNQNHIFTFLDGFTKVVRACAEGDLNPAGYIQVEIATKVVDLKGTYSFRAQGTASEGGQMALLAFQTNASDLQPLDWNHQLPETTRGPRRGQTAGEFAPPFVTSAGLAPLSWQSTTPDPVRLRRGVAVSGSVEPVSTDPRALPLSTYPDRTPGARRPLNVGGQAMGESPIPPVPALSWAAVYPDAAAPRRQTRAESTAFVVIVAPAAPFVPGTFPDHLTARPRPAIQGGTSQPEATIPAPVVPLLSWQASYPDTTRAPRPVNAGGPAGPEATIPTPPSPPLAWLAAYPDIARRALRVVNVGGESGPHTIVAATPSPYPTYGGPADASGNTYAGAVPTGGTYG